MTAPRLTTSEGGEELNEVNTLRIIALWEKIIGQKSFSTEGGSFRDREGYAIGKLRIEEKNLEIIAQQNQNNGARTIVAAKISDGMPLASCTIPSDGSESTIVRMDGALTDPRALYDGIVALLADKQIDAAEVTRLMSTRADEILTGLV